MRSIDFTACSFTQKALILTFSPKEKEPLRNSYTDHHLSSLPPGETLAHAAVRAVRGI